MAENTNTNPHIVINPFVYSRPVTSNEFIGREKFISRIFSRLASGQSIAIIGQPHIGKTSLLRYILDVGASSTEYHMIFANDYFCYLDAQTLGAVNTQTKFWKLALNPLEEAIKKNKLENTHQMSKLFHITAQNGYGTFVLEKLFKELYSIGTRYILMIDEFDDFLNNPVLHCAEFYGSLRALSSYSGGLILIIATRQSIDQLSRQTQEINPYGSPYFNVFLEFHLETLDTGEFNQLLSRAGDRFTQRDREYIEKISGRNPYLAQAASAALWDADEDGLTGTTRYKNAAKDLRKQTREHFSDTWTNWDNATRKVITAIALSQIPRFLGAHTFKTEDLLENFLDYEPELEALETAGILSRNVQNEWDITQDALLWWLADELLRNMRDEISLKDWLKAQEIDNLLTPKELQQVSKAAKNALDYAGKGAIALIEGLAKGFGEGFGKAVTNS